MALSYPSPGVYVEEIPSGNQPIAGVGTSTAGFVGVISDPISVPVLDPSAPGDSTATPAVPKGVKITTPVLFDAKKPKLVTNWSEFTKYFGDYSTNVDQNRLAHAVYGFFNNGGTRCFVIRFETLSELQDGKAFVPFESIDEIALVAAPGIDDPTVQGNLLAHCSQMKDRFAILDCAPDITDDLTEDNIKRPGNDNYGAFYFPWIKVFDPATKIMNKDNKDIDGMINVGPSGHIAGIYARVDTERGVHKAPANEVVRGASGLRYPISKSIQDGLNPYGINCIRDINNAIKVWGARTIGGDDNGEWKYINVRRLFLFLRESIDKGTQWVVFEPNDQALWAKITRNVTAFLTTVWRSGALFGSTPQEAFYVKCDAETNPPEVRDQGQVVTEIGVAVVKPAEFVIFRISQWAGPGK
jgi:phage tail sheath protein FI